MQVGLVGSGDRFDALVALLNQTNTDVLLWNHDKRKKKDLPKGVKVVPLEELIGVHLIFFSLPIDEVRDVADILGEHLTGRHAIVHLCRNLEHTSLKTISQILAEETPTFRFAHLTGPMNSEDILAGLPASGVCATKFDEIQDYVADVLVTSKFRLYRGNDLLGAEVASAYCRVIAMALGVAAELHLGRSLQSTLYSRGLAEMGRFVEHRGGRERTTFGLAGSANLFVDTMDKGSPDFQIGQEAMQKNLFDSAAVVKKFGSRGKDLLDLVESLAVELKHTTLNLHILETAHYMVSGQMGPSQAVEHLMSLPTLDD